MTMDDQFTKKMYRSVVLAWAIAMIWSLALGKPWIALSITLGVLLGTAVFASYELVIRRVFVPGASRPQRALIKLAMIKLPIIGASFYVLVRCDKISMMAFCGGMVLVHFAMLAKLAGIRMVERRESGSGPLVLH